MFIRSAALAACLWGLYCSTAMAAPASPEKEAGVAEWKQGSVEYALGHFPAAAVHYEEAYRQLQDPALLFNVAQARRLAGQRDGALSAYRSYLRAAAPNAPDRDLAQKRITELESTPGAVPLAHAPADAPASLLDTQAASASRGSSADEKNTRWWLWGAAGALIVGAGVAAVLVLANQKDIIGAKDGAVVIK